MNPGTLASGIKLILGIKGGYEVPSFMSDKQKQRIANDPIRALKYGNQLTGFSDDFNKS